MRLLFRGEGTRAGAERLVIERATVQDHVKSILGEPDSAPRPSETTCEDVRVDLVTFRRLLGDEGRQLRAQVPASAELSELALAERLRARFDADLVAAAMAQHQLRRKAVAKFGTLAERMWFTPDALQQATRAAVARHRADRLAASGARAVVDLCCGIGSDLIAFAAAGLRVRGVERDPVRAAIAQANLDALGLPGIVECADAERVTVRPDETAFLDPARRNGRGRVFDLDAMSPPWPLVVERLARGAVVKTLPGIAHEAVPDGAEAEWVSVNGQLVEACLWGAPLARTHRRATCLPGEATVAGDPMPAPVGPLCGWLYEPDDAVIRSGLINLVAEQLGAHLIEPKIAYLTADSPMRHAMARGFRVVAELPYRTRQLRAALRSRDVGPLTVKKRGVDVDPHRLVAELKLTGDKPATIVMTRIGGNGTCLLVEPVPRDDPVG